MIHDRFTISDANVPHAIRIWLMASYIYYLRPDLDSFITDSEFDTITQILIDNYEVLTTYETFSNGETKKMSDLITLDDLRAGTGFALREHEYPSITKNAATMIVKDKFLTLKQEFIFTYPHVKRIRKRYRLDKSRVADCFDVDRLYDCISAREPALQDPERYYQTDRDSDYIDEERERRSVILKDNEAEEFLNGMLYSIDTNMEQGLVLGNIYYRDGVGWVGQVFEPTRTFIVQRSNCG